MKKYYLMALFINVFSINAAYESISKDEDSECITYGGIDVTGYRILVHYIKKDGRYQGFSNLSRFTGEESKKFFQELKYLYAQQENEK